MTSLRLTRARSNSTDMSDLSPPPESPAKNIKRPAPAPFPFDAVINSPLSTPGHTPNPTPKTTPKRANSSKTKQVSRKRSLSSVALSPEPDSSPPKARQRRSANAGNGVAAVSNVGLERDSMLSNAFRKAPIKTYKRSRAQHVAASNALGSDTEEDDDILSPPPAVASSSLDTLPSPTAARRRIESRSSTTSLRRASGPSSSRILIDIDLDVSSDSDSSTLNIEEGLDDILQGSSQSNRGVKRGRGSTFRPSKLPLGVDEGDTCLFKDLRNWFPARLVKFNPAQSEAILKTQGRREYTIEEQTGRIREMRRDQLIFLIREDMKSLAECTLGDMYSEVIDESSRLSPRRRAQTLNGDTERPPTPELERETGLSLREELSQEEFFNLNLRSQVIAIRDHLARVVKEEYAPAQWRVDRFFSGGAARAALAGEVQYGTVTENDTAEVLVPELLRWASRDGGLGDGVDADAAESPTRPPRPLGSSRYEALRQSDRQAYVMDILVPEALIQICVRVKGLGADAETDHKTDTDRGTEIYETAREELSRMTEESAATQWSRRRRQINAFRARAIEKYGIKKLHESEEPKQETGWAGGRARKKVVYKE